MIKKYAEVFNLNESANTLNEAKGAMVSKELMKATDKMHTEQLKQQELQKKFVSETDADKKNKMKADLIAQHKKVKDAERNFQEALGREHVDYDDELLESDSQLNEGAILKAIKPSLEGEVKAAVEALEKELQSTGAILDYKHADELAYLIIDIIDAAKQEERDEVSESATVVNENGSIKLSSKDKQLIKRFQNWAVDNPTSTDVDFFSAKHKLNSEQRYLLKKVFLSGDFQITAAGPLPSDIKPRIG